MSWNLNVIRWYSNLFPFIFGWVSLCLWVNPDHIMLLFRYIIKGPEYSKREIDKLEWLEMMLNYRLKTLFKRNSIDIELYLQSWLYCISLTVSLKFNEHGCTILVDFQAWFVYFNFCVFFSELWHHPIVLNINFSELNRINNMIRISVLTYEQFSLCVVSLMITF